MVGSSGSSPPWWDLCSGPFGLFLFLDCDPYSSSDRLPNVAFPFVETLSVCASAKPCQPIFKVHALSLSLSLGRTYPGYCPRDEPAYLPVLEYRLQALPRQSTTPRSLCSNTGTLVNRRYGGGGDGQARCGCPIGEEDLARWDGGPGAREDVARFPRSTRKKRAYVSVLATATRMGVGKVTSVQSREPLWPLRADGV